MLHFMVLAAVMRPENDQEEEIEVQGEQREVQEEEQREVQEEEQRDNTCLALNL